MTQRIRCIRSHHILCVVVLAFFVVSGTLAFIPSVVPVQAQIDNNQPGQPYASLVDCIRTGSDRGFPSSDSPQFATTCFGTKLTAGGYTAGGGGSDDADPADTAVLYFGDAQVDGTDDLMGAISHTQLANLAQVGSVYGLAFNSGTNPAAPTGAPRQRRLFAGAFDKMQTRFGSGGPGAIYVINQSTGVVSLFVQVPDVVPGPNGFPGDPGDGSLATFPNVASEPTYTPESGGVHRNTSDSIARDLVGKVSLGDIDMSPDERYLYAVNLNTKRIYRFDTWDANPQSTMFLVPDWVAPLNPCSAVGGAGVARPFGLKVTNTEIFLGVVCSAEATQNRADLRAGVAQYDRTTGSWSWAFQFSLDSFDAQREPVAAVETRWYAWRDGITGFHSGVHQTYPQPLITDIEIGEGGSMFVGMRDRFGDMTSDEPYTPSSRSEGDLLRATPNGSGGWNVPPSGGSEFFNDQSGGGSGQEPEAASGGLAYVPGNHSGAVGGEIVSTYLDPYRSRSFGIGWWDTATGGTPTAREEIYQGSLSTGTH